MEEGYHSPLGSTTAHIDVFPYLLQHFNHNRCDSNNLPKRLISIFSLLNSAMKKGIYIAFTLTLLLTLTAGGALPGSSLPSPRLGNIQDDEKQTHDITPRDATVPDEAIASCRATCIEQILQWPPTNDDCLGTKDCLDCWEMCSKLYQDEYNWRPMCTDDDQCVEGFGCSLACKFDFASASMPVVMPMLFKTTPITTAPSDQKLVIAWDTPVPVISTGHDASPPYFIYTLLFRDEANPHWIRVITTMELSATVDGPHTTFRGLEFLLIASASRGTVAQDYPPYPTALDIPPVAVPSEPERPVEHHPKYVEEVPAAPFDQFPAKMSGVIVRTLTGPGGSLEAEMTWIQDIPTSEKFVYSISWSLVSCNVDSSMPPCHLGHDEKYTIQVKATQKEDMRIVLTGLVYNSQYSLDVGFQGADTSESSVFFTPACPNVDATYRTCIPSTDPPKRTERVTESTTTTSTSTTPPTTSTTTTPKPSTTMSIAASPAAPSLVTEDRFKNFLPLLLQAREKRGVNGGMPVDVILLSTGVTFGSFFLIVAIFMIYKRFCKKPDPTTELAKVLQSYSELQLLDPSTPTSLSSSIHRLHALSQNVINMSPATPTSYMATPPGHNQMAVSSPNIMALQQNLLLRAAANAATEARSRPTHPWHSMDIIQDTPPNMVQTAANVHQPFIRPRSTVVVAQETMVGIDSYGTPQITMVTPSKQRKVTPNSTSMEHLNIQVPDIRRAASFSDISPTARRQINFSTSVTAQPPSSPSPIRHQVVGPTIVVSSPTAQEETSVSQVELVPQQDCRYLRTVCEEGWLDEEEDFLDDPNEEGQFGEVLQWDYNFTLPFTNRVETM